MQRRDFLLKSLAGGLAACLPTSVLAGADTYQAYRAGLARHPRLAMLAGTQNEMLAGEASISGRWPKALAGMFYRNGPARLERGGERYEHWFDGDGMVHAWRMADGRVSHLGRMVRTQKYREEAAADQLLYPGFGTAIARRPIGNNDSVNAANTSALPHAGKLYAMWEGGSATELDPQTLATRGLKTWRDDLTALPFSAHPKVEPDGTLWNIGAVPGVNKLVLWHIRPDGSLARVQLLNVADIALVHDFVVTERHIVLLLPPFSLNRTPGISYLAMHQWQGQRAMRVLVIDKADLTLKHTLEMPARMVFHFGNAFDDGDSIRLDATLYQDDQVLQEMAAAMRGVVWDKSVPSVTSQLTLDLRRGQVREERLLAASEFPRVADAVVGRRHRALFTLIEDAQHGMGMGGVARIDLDGGKIDRFAFGPDWVVEEHVPVARPDGRGLWLVGPALDLRRRQTVLNVFDAANLAQGPLAQARLPYAAPLCFHGNFLST